MGGYPCEPPRGCAPWRVPWAYGQGCHHILGGQRPMLGLPQGGDCGIMTQQGPWHPCLGGGGTLSRGIAGVSAPLPFPRYILPDGPPYLGARLCITLKALGVNLSVVKIGKNELNDTGVFLHVVVRHACRFFW